MELNKLISYLSNSNISTEVFILVKDIVKENQELKEKLESALASSDDYQDRWMQATAKLEAIGSNKVAEFSGVVTEDGLSKFLNLYNEKNKKVGMLIGYEDGEIDSEMKVTISKDKQ